MLKKKFRIWVRGAKKFLTEEHGNLYGAYILDYFRGMKPDADFLLFSGVWDKDWKEIYEGDVVRIRNEHGVQRCEIVFKKGVFRLKDFIGSSDILGNWEQNELKVVGNVFQNKKNK